MRKFWFLVILSMALVIFSGCNNTEQNTEVEPEESTSEETNGQEENGSEQNGTQDNEQNQKNEEKVNNQEDSEQKEAADEEKSDIPQIVTDEIVAALAEKNMEKLASFVHPSKGVRFSPYGYVNIDEHLLFTATEVKGLMSDDTVYHWGSFDGSGKPIEMTFAEYYDRFVYDADYLNAKEKSVDERLGQGNTIDNTDDVYPEATVVEYHFPEIDPQYEGMDWRSLRIVLEKEAGQWYLVGIIHDEWTI